MARFAVELRGRQELLLLDSALSVGFRSLPGDSTDLFRLLLTNLRVRNPLVALVWSEEGYKWLDLQWSLVVCS